MIVNTGELKNMNATTRREPSLSLAPSGWRLFRQVFPDPAREAAEEWIDAVALRAEQDSGLEPEFEPLLLDGRLAARKLRRLFWNDEPFWTELFQRCNLLELGASFLAGTPALIYHAAFLKARMVGSKVALHQDQALWNHDYPGAVSMWVALTDCDEGNGCLELCPESHHRGLVPHQWDSMYAWHPCISSKTNNIPAPEKVPMQAGDVLVWHRYMVHGSGRNCSSSDRKGMVLVFANAAEPNFTARDTYKVMPFSALDPVILRG